MNNKQMRFPIHLPDIPLLRHLATAAKDYDPGGISALGTNVICLFLNLIVLRVFDQGS